MNYEELRFTERQANTVRWESPNTGDVWFIDEDYFSGLTALQSSTNGFEIHPDENDFPIGGVKELTPQEVLDKCRTSKLDEIRTECENQIVAGFISNALGYEVHYRCNRDDQDMIREAHYAGGGLIWRNEVLTSHDATQASQVYTDMVAHRDTNCKVKYANKMAYIIHEDRTAEEIEAVTWDSVEP